MSASLQVKGPRRPVLWCCRRTPSWPVPHPEPGVHTPLWSRRKSRQHVLARRAAIRVGCRWALVAAGRVLQGGRQDNAPRALGLCSSTRSVSGKAGPPRSSPGHWPHACQPLPEGKEGAGLPRLPGAEEDRLRALPVCPPSELPEPPCVRASCPRGLGDARAGVLLSPWPRRPRGRPSAPVSKECLGTGQLPTPAQLPKVRVRTSQFVG